MAHHSEGNVLQCASVNEITRDFFCYLLSSGEYYDDRLLGINSQALKSCFSRWFFREKVMKFYLYQGHSNISWPPSYFFISTAEDLRARYIFRLYTRVFIGPSRSNQLRLLNHCNASPERNACEFLFKMAALCSAVRLLTRRGICQTARAFSLGSTSRTSVAVVSIMTD